jgi:hypothetical protein
MRLRVHEDGGIRELDVALGELIIAPLWHSYETAMVLMVARKSTI